MDLIDGLKHYKSNETYWRFTIEIEADAKCLMEKLRMYGEQPNRESLRKCKEFLLKIEKWKGMCLQERMGNAVRNTEQTIWDAFLGAISANNDIEAIRSIMRLIGFGSSVDENTGQRRAKVATSVLRFLNPKEWGVVDWRTIAMLTILKKHNMDIGKSLGYAKSIKAYEQRDIYKIVDENLACEINKEYRIKRTEPDLPRAADIDMALFGLSMKVWPI